MSIGVALVCRAKSPLGGCTGPFPRESVFIDRRAIPLTGSAIHQLDTLKFVGVHTPDQPTPFQAVESKLKIAQIYPYTLAHNPKGMRIKISHEFEILKLG